MSLENVEQHLENTSEASAFDVGELVRFCRKLEQRIQHLEKEIIKLTDNNQKNNKINKQLNDDYSSSEE